MRLNDVSIYKLASLSMTLDELFEKDAKIRSINERLNQNINNEVFDPEISSEGLRKRILRILTVSISLTIYAFILGFGSIFLGFMFFDEPSPIVIHFSLIPYSMIGASIHIALFRAQRAFLDEKRFKREGKPQDFSINTKAHIRWYDLFMGIPFGLFFYFL